MKCIFLCILKKFPMFVTFEGFLKFPMVVTFEGFLRYCNLRSWIPDSLWFGLVLKCVFINIFFQVPITTKFPRLFSRYRVLHHVPLSIKYKCKIHRHLSILALIFYPHVKNPPIEKNTTFCQQLTDSVLGNSAQIKLSICTFSIQCNICTYKIDKNCKFHSINKFKFDWCWVISSARCASYGLFVVFAICHLNKKAMLLW